MGHGTRIYTSLLPAPATAPDRHAFAPWETAQSAWLDASRQLAEALRNSLAGKSFAVTISSAPVSPLNHLTTAAVAVECAPSGGDPAQLASSRYQQSLAAALADGIAAARRTLEVAP